MDPAKTIQTLTNWLSEALPKNNGLLVPVSGGSDSAFCFWLCNQVVSERTKGVFAGKNLRQHEWFNGIGGVDLLDFEAEGENPEVMRWAEFLVASLQENRVLVGSRNRTEDNLGTFSNASRAAAFLPLAGLWKSEVMQLCEHIGVPKEIIDSSQRADPECGRPESLAEIPFEFVDIFLQVKLGEKSNDTMKQLSAEQADYLEELYASHSFKTKLPLKGPVSQA